MKERKKERKKERLKERQANTIRTAKEQKENRTHTHKQRQLELDKKGRVNARRVFSVLWVY